MGIIATNSGGSAAPIIEAGTFVAIAVQMVHIGTVKEEYEGKQKILDKIRIAWELPTEKHVYNEEKGEESRMISKEYTLSLHEKSTLRKDLEAWRGKAFTAKELEGFDVTNVIGVACQVSITHKTSAKNKTYAKISSVSKVMKGVAIPEATIPQVLFMYDQPVGELVEVFKALPEFIQDKIVTSDEWAALKIERPVNESKDEAPAAGGTVPTDEVAEAAADATTPETIGDAPPF